MTERRRSVEVSIGELVVEGLDPGAAHRIGHRLAAELTAALERVEPSALGAGAPPSAELGTHIGALHQGSEPRALAAAVATVLTAGTTQRGGPR